MRFKILLTFLSIYSAIGYAIISDELQLIMIAQNTLDSVRNLKEIVTESREFNEEFERIYAKVDQAVYKAERTQIWLEDLNDIAKEEIKNLDDFNFVLARLKHETQDIRETLKEQYRKNEIYKKNANIKINDNKKIDKRIRKYALETKSSTSPTVAQIETSRNTKDILIESARTNKKLNEVNIELAKLNKYFNDVKTKETIRDLDEKRKLNTRSKGILNKEMLRVRR